MRRGKPYSTHIRSSRTSWNFLPQGSVATTIPRTCGKMRQLTAFRRTAMHHNSPSGDQSIQRRAAPRLDDLEVAILVVIFGISLLLLGNAALPALLQQF